ncbi:DUF2683 family protein [Candidatus Woesearchaeota archaeon]|nr:DUF2683 family protein [Candidatus Woesearchaeota archaeon]
MVLARVVLSKYSDKVLNVVKAKFDLKDKSEALNKFVELYGDEVVEREAKDQYVKKVIGISERHLKKYDSKKMSIKELDKLCEVS